jgi:hypothetical protein
MASLLTTGLPQQFTRTGIPTPTKLLSSPFTFVVTAESNRSNCEALVWENTPAIAQWTVRCTATDHTGLVQIVTGSLDADGADTPVVLVSAFLLEVARAVVCYC